MLPTKQVLGQLKAKPDILLKCTSSASICHKSELPERKVTHWPYQTRSWNYLNFFLDPFTKRKFNENTKVIQIEGNIAAGKQDFAERLADELGMKVMPEIDLNDIYRNEHGYDYCALNPLLPERLRFCDWEMFHENPSRHSVIHMQYYIYKLRFRQYFEALQHIFNTGQGVILNRSVFSDRVFVEAMHDLGWLPHGYLRGDGFQFYDWKQRYLYIRNLTLLHLPMPHLTIYLDTPVDVCMDRIKNSSDPMIANSKAMIPEFLEGIKDAYDTKFLPKAEYNGHVMRIDYPKKADQDQMDEIIDNIKQLDFEFDWHDTRFSNWDRRKMKLWHFWSRMTFTTTRYSHFIDKLDQPTYDIAGLGDSITQADLMLRSSLMQQHVGPFGQTYTVPNDPSRTNPLWIFLGLRNFKQRQDEQWSEFV